MKKLILITCLISLIIACGNSETKSKKIVRNWLNTNLDDFSGYEDISFSLVDSSYSTFLEDYQLLISDSINLDKIFNSNIETSLSYSKMHEMLKAKELMEAAEKVADSSKKINLLLTNARNTWKPAFNGYSIIHEYRAKNEHGLLKKHRVYFHIYKDFSGCEPIYDLK